ncbi:aldolase catalytic domain-containing protein [bacterium]|nr:aldolase catalytic domain-containing protein [bacterium]
MEENTVSQTDGKGTWVTWRQEIKVLDCSIRDGGLMNDHQFEDSFVRAVYDTCVAAGVDYMELGYKSSRRIYAPGEFGAWKFCSEDDLRRIVGDNPTDLKLSVMADVGRTDYHEDILPADDSVLDMIRVATYIHQIPGAIEIIQDAHQKGYETTVNLMAVSAVHESDLDDALEAVAQTNVDAIYLVDSFGAFYSEEIEALTRKYLAITDATGKQLGIHTHNNQQLAYANTIEAIVHGANYLDATIGGLGRGAGNCPLELLIAFLKNPAYHLRPILQCLEQQIAPLREKVHWGYDLPYLITGMLNQHPREAMRFMDAAQRGSIVEFYDTLTEQV